MTMPTNDKPKKKRDGEDNEEDVEVVVPESDDLEEDGSEPDERRRDPLRRPV